MAVSLAAAPAALPATATPVQQSNKADHQLLGILGNTETNENIWVDSDIWTDSDIWED